VLSFFWQGFHFLLFNINFSYTQVSWGQYKSSLPPHQGFKCWRDS